MDHSGVFPFSALVGQEKMKLGLILNVIDPTIDGVLIRGERGTAKSTAVRALARLLPERVVVEGCQVGCSPAKASMLCPECTKLLLAKGALPTVTRKMRVVDLPVGSTEDRVVGALDIEAALKTGTMEFIPGILGKANGGFLYVDEVNLLEDHIVDVLLDSAAMGINRIEREGVSYSHPARFVLVGTMNPEEGDLRPQLLDRFGLCVEVRGISDPELRVEVMRRRRAFERDPQRFSEEWTERDLELGAKIANAEKLLKHISVDDETLEVIAALSIDLGADGHRADMAMVKTVSALAAFKGRQNVTDEDIREAAELVYPHRMKKNPLEERILSEEEVVTSIKNSREKLKEKKSTRHGKKKAI
ncbi:MAG: magnesium chelatase ATPase subunit I [Deltaproteobacteria bacterium]|nr:MAG: magnesium chelatase ATPase subunit I [Deltaproteobacteria bacterium]